MLSFLEKNFMLLYWYIACCIFVTFLFFLPHYDINYEYYLIILYMFMFVVCFWPLLLVSILYSNIIKIIKFTILWNNIYKWMECVQNEYRLPVFLKWLILYRFTRSINRAIFISHRMHAYKWCLHQNVWVHIDEITCVWACDWWLIPRHVMIIIKLMIFMKAYDD